MTGRLARLEQAERMLAEISTATDAANVADFAEAEYGEQLAWTQWDALVQGNAVIEAKRARRADPVLYVEVEQHPKGKLWQPSGLLDPRSEADWFWFVKPRDVGIAVSKSLLLRAYETGPQIKGGGFHGDNPTRGFTVCIACLIGGGWSLDGCGFNHRHRRSVAS